MFHEEASTLALDDLDLSRFCGVVFDFHPQFPELTEDELQQLEEKADNWYLGIADVL